VASAGARFDDPAISPVVRQTLHHWAYELNEADFQAGAKAFVASGHAPYISSHTAAAGAAAAAKRGAGAAAGKKSARK